MHPCHGPLWCSILSTNYCAPSAPAAALARPARSKVLHSWRGRVETAVTAANRRQLEDRLAEVIQVGGAGLAALECGARIAIY